MKGAPRGTTLPWSDALLLVSVVALWGFNFVPIRWALDDVPPFALAASRFFLAALPAVFFVRRPRLPFWILVGYGLAIGVGQFGLLFLAIHLGMPAGLASLLIQVQVFVTTGLAALVLGDGVRISYVVGSSIAALGLVGLGIHRFDIGASTMLTLLLVLAAAASWAVGNVLAKVAARRQADMFALVVWSSLAVPLPLIVLSAAVEGTSTGWNALAHAGLRAWASILFMTYAATHFGFAVWNRMLHRHPSGLVAPFALIVPVAGLASAAILLGEGLDRTEVLAAAVIMAGLAVAVFGDRMRRRLATPPAA